MRYKNSMNKEILITGWTCKTAETFNFCFLHPLLFIAAGRRIMFFHYKMGIKRLLMLFSSAEEL